MQLFQTLLLLQQAAWPCAEHDPQASPRYGTWVARATRHRLCGVFTPTLHITFYVLSSPEAASDTESHCSEQNMQQAAASGRLQRPFVGIAAPAITAARARPAVCCSSLGRSLCCSLQQQRTASGLRRQYGSSRPRRDRGRQLQPCASASAAVWAAASYDAPVPSGGGDSAWEPPAARRFPAFLAAIRAALFYTTTFLFAAPLFCLMLLAYPYVMAFDKFRCAACWYRQRVRLSAAALAVRNQRGVLALTLRWRARHAPRLPLPPSPPGAGGGPSTPSTPCGPS